MAAFDNPFYILGSTPLDDRQRISSSAEAKALLLDTGIVMEAHNTLLTPRKRLAAEIRWFPGLDRDDSTKMLDFCAELKKGICAEEPDSTNFGDLAALNVRLCIIPFQAFDGIFSVKYSVLAISRLFESIDTQTLKEEINRDRILSGFPILSDITEIEDELYAHRRELRQIISAKLSELPSNIYVEIALLLSEKYSEAEGRYEGNSIIADVLDDYDLRTAPERERQKQQIMEAALRIEQPSNSLSQSDYLRDLSKLIEQWNKITRPLQLATKARGQQHTESSSVANTIRDVAIKLHNNQGRTAEALVIISALEKQFIGLSDFHEQVCKDASTLARLQQEKEDNTLEYEESLRHNRLDKKYTVTIWADQVMIPPFCTCCLKPTQSTETISTSTSQQTGLVQNNRTVSLKMPVCSECLEHREKVKDKKWFVVMLPLLFSAVSIPLFLLIVGSNSSGVFLPSLLVSIGAYIFVGLKSKLPTLGNEHSTRQQSVWISNISMAGSMTNFSFTNWRYAKMFAEANNSMANHGADIGALSMREEEYRNRAKDPAYIKSIDHPIQLCFLVVVLTIAMWLVVGQPLASIGNSLADSSTQASIGYNTPSGTALPSTKGTPSPSQVKQRSLDALKTELDALERDIGVMEDDLSDLSNDIDYYEAQYYETHSDIYVGLYNGAVDRYNILWIEYDRAIDTYNDMVNEYNSLLG